MVKKKKKEQLLEDCNLEDIYNRIKDWNTASSQSYNLQRDIANRLFNDSSLADAVNRVKVESLWEIAYQIAEEIKEDYIIIDKRNYGGQPNPKYRRR